MRRYLLHFLVAAFVTAVLVAGGLALNKRWAAPARRAPEGVVLDGRPRKIIDGVYALGEFFPVSIYLVEAADGLVLVDTGFLAERPKVSEAIRSLGLDPAKVKHVLVTHLHLDHVMAAEAWRQDTGARIYAGAADARALEAGASWDQVYPSRVPPAGFLVPLVRIDHPIAADEDLPIPGVKIRALLTPGHTPGSTCYLLEKDGWRVLFSGDTLMSVARETGTYTATLHPRYGGDPQAYLESVGKLREVPVDVLLPGHPYFDRGAGGTSPSPFLAPGDWSRRLALAAAELGLTILRLDTDGADFLDDKPRRLAPGLLYLGLMGPTAAYALETRDGLVLVDPGPPESGFVLWKRLADLGYTPREVTSVLLTRVHPDLSGLLPEVLVSTGARLLCPEGEADSVEGLPVHRRIADGETLDLGGVQVRAVWTPLESPGSMSYLVRLGGKLAVFTGDALGPLTADDALAFPDLRPPCPAGKPAVLRGYAALGAESVDLWLPAHPFATPNANLYDAAWPTLVTRNSERIERP